MNNEDNEKHLYFQAIDWYSGDITPETETNNDSDNNNDNAIVDYDAIQIESPKYLIKCFGRDKNGESISLNINDYTPHFYLKIIDKVVPKSEYNRLCQLIEKMMREKLPKYLKESISKVSIVTRKDMWGFNNSQKYKFLLISMTNLRAMRYVTYNIFKGDSLITLDKNNKWLKNLELKLYENNIEPHLRFMHKQDIHPSGWLKINKKNLMKSNIYAMHKGETYDINWKNVKSYNECDDIVPFRVCSFDIECTSFDGSFPAAIQNYNKLAYMLYQKYDKIKASSKKEIGIKEITEELINIIIEEFKNDRINIKDDSLSLSFNKENLDKLNVIQESLMRDKRILEALQGKYSLDRETQMKIDIQEKKKRKHNEKVNKYFGYTPSSENDTSNDKNSELNIGKTEIIYVLTKLLSEHLPEIKGDPIIQIGVTIHLYGNKDISERYLLVVGGCSDISEDIEIIRCKTELELIKKWVKLMQKTDPDIITGYNIFGFDYDYIYQRASELNCISELCKLGKTKHPVFECKYGDRMDSELPDEDGMHSCQTHWKKKSLSSSALGDNYLKYIFMEGRISVDLMKIVQKEYKLATYKLDYVSSYFLNGVIKDIDMDNKWLILDNIAGLQLDCYINISQNGSQNGSDGDDDEVIKYKIIELDKINNRIKIESIDLLDNEKKQSLIGQKWGLAKDDITPNDIFECVKSGNDDDRAKIGKYCVQDCALCNYLLIRLEIIANNIGMSNVCSVPLSYIFLRGQGVKGFSLIAKHAKEDGSLIPFFDKSWKCEICNTKNESRNEECSNKMCRIPKPDADSYEGAIVLEPKPGIYVDKPIAVFDYASLYPSSIISENISFDTLVINEEYNNLEGHEYVDITFDTYKGKKDKKVKSGEQTCRFAQYPDGKKGLLPRILQCLLGERKAVKKKMKWKIVTYKDADANVDANAGIVKSVTGSIISTNEDKTEVTIKVNDEETIKLSNVIGIKCAYNEFYMNILEGRQLALKLSANSLYGLVGANTSPIYMPELASSTTATGRNLLMKAKSYAEKEYNATTIYGDSDSVFLSFPIKEDCKRDNYSLLKYVNDIGVKIESEFQKYLKPPHCLEFEKQYFPYILFSKKRYVGKKYEGSIEKWKLDCKGIALKRRDYAPIVKTVYGGAIDIILHERNIEKSLTFLDNSLNDIIIGKFPMKYFIMSKTLKGFYKIPHQNVHKVLADRMQIRDPGSAPQINDRVQFVYIKLSNKEIKTIKEREGRDKILQGERVEDPEYAKEHNLKIDYEFYITNQIMKPILQLYALVLEELKGYKHYDKKYYEKKEKRMMMDNTNIKTEGDRKKIIKKIGLLRQKDVEKILFSKYLREFENKKKGDRSITDWFPKVDS